MNKVLIGMVLLTTLSGASASANGAWTKYRFASSYEDECMLVQETSGKIIMNNYSDCGFKDSRRWKAISSLTANINTGSIISGVYYNGKICDSLKVVKRDSSITILNYCAGKKLPSGEIEPVAHNYILAADEIVCAKD